MQKSAIFFDRDGVLNEDFGYVYRPIDFKWIPGAVETIKHLKAIGYTIIVITNQSGVARGYFSEDDVNHLHHWINNDLLQKQNVQIDSFYYCPHHPTVGIEPYLTKCECRKPRPGLILEAISDYNIDRKKSYFIGDKDTDMEAAAAAGIRGYKFSSECLYDFMMHQNIL
ncbi:D-glycero-beta-D-manno-heptose 1,7-bisphosphate 7-phosphatase [Bacillus sp. S/N-304-OC-R1]|uniref:D-glycero-alpha-D-manno-heptose-1,7-bisphosphate 7-phosphatase n=1 Tax=Bacillus sp. S/N-304-OC-R1 TaxID=2758034 RepID=UPI001C8EB779|nr:HAD family hydrolase [Bacillus sp. S/N-304-OC-R1]MBY0124255.1 HAD family hydrolase [Bacillus sp. S/N-304-OC-R1]